MMEMIPVIVRTVANLASVAINCIAISVTFRGRYKGLVQVSLFVLFTSFLAAILFGTGGANIPFGGVLGSYGGLYALLYLPLIIWLYKGLFFQKIFVVISTLLISVAQSYIVMAIVEIFIEYGSDRYFLVLLFAILIVYGMYAGVMLKFGWSFMKKLFTFGSQYEWALYTFGVMFSYAALMFLHDAPIGKALYIFLLIFILWSFIVICFAIINTHEKAKQRFEAEFARSIVSSGRDHYQKMDEMYDKLRTLRHDYKYHLSAARKMLSSGNLEEADQCLTDVESKLSEGELQGYCVNTVINALVASFAERCAKLNIQFNVDISALKTGRIPNYEMCIIIGNLLENAVEACEKLEHGRTIELAAQNIPSQILLMVKNSFNGIIYHDDGTPISGKVNGGFGLRSIREVIYRYGGDLHTEWDEDTFTAYAAVRL